MTRSVPDIECLESPGVTASISAADPEALLAREPFREILRRREELGIADRVDCAVVADARPVERIERFESIAKPEPRGVLGLVRVVKVAPFEPKVVAEHEPPPGKLFLEVGV